MIPPFIESRLIRYVTQSSVGIDTTQIDDLRQGVEIRTDKHRFVTGQPKIWSGRIDHVNEETTFGQKRLANSDNVFIDLDKFDGALFIKSGGRSMLPMLVDDAASIDSDIHDGVLEPLTIRRRASFETIDFPGDPHEIKASFTAGNNDIFGR